MTDRNLRITEGFFVIWSFTAANSFDALQYIEGPVIFMVSSQTCVLIISCEWSSNASRSGCEMDSTSLLQ